MPPRRTGAFSSGDADACASPSLPTRLAIGVVNGSAKSSVAAWGCPSGSASRKAARGSSAARIDSRRGVVKGVSVAPGSRAARRAMPRRFSSSTAPPMTPAAEHPMMCFAPVSWAIIAAMSGSAWAWSPLAWMMSRSGVAPSAASICSPAWHAAEAGSALIESACANFGASCSLGMGESSARFADRGERDVCVRACRWPESDRWRSA